MKKINKNHTILFLSILLSTVFFNESPAQKREHLIGVRTGYIISGMDTRPTIEIKNINTYQNYGIIYTYYHDLWGYINLFGFQSGISKNEVGFSYQEKITRYEVITLPFVSQFHFDFWKMRLLLNAGGFGGYRINKETTDEIGFDKHDYRYDYGFIAGGGLALKLKPFEFHLEGNYNYSLSYLHNPKKFSETDYLFTYPHALLISLTLYLHL